jgi:hypothetical protein
MPRNRALLPRRCASLRRNIACVSVRRRGIAATSAWAGRKYQS